MDAATTETLPKITSAFESWASNLLCTGRCRDADIDENLLPDIYLFDRTTGALPSGERRGRGLVDAEHRSGPRRCRPGRHLLVTGAVRTGGPDRGLRSVRLFAGVSVTGDDREAPLRSFASASGRATG